MKASSRVLLIHPSNDHAAVGVGARCIAGKSACLHSLWCFPFVPKRNGQLFREFIIFDCPDLLDRAFCERMAFGKISVRQLCDLGLIFQKFKTDLAPVAVVVCPIGVDCGGDFFVFLLLRDQPQLQNMKDLVPGQMLHHLFQCTLICTFRTAGPAALEQHGEIFKADALPPITDAPAGEGMRFLSATAPAFVGYCRHTARAAPV